MAPHRQHHRAKGPENRRRRGTDQRCNNGPVPWTKGWNGRFWGILDSQNISLYNPRAPLSVTAQKAQVAQLVEHVTENHGVGGSIPPLGTTNPPLRPAMATITVI
jgi:hypothetical protein